MKYCRHRTSLRLLRLEDRITPAGALDPTFGSNGMVTTPYFGNGTFAEAVTVDGLGRTLVAGSTGQGVMVTRYRFDGALDVTFGGTGIVRFGFRPDGGFGGWDAKAYAITVDPNGRILVAGTGGPLVPQQYDFAVARLLDTGALDPSFNGNGKRLIDFGYQDFADDIAIDSQGRIILGGHNTNSVKQSARFEVARLTEAGALDDSFGVGGKQVVDFGGATQPGTAMAIDPLDRVVMAGLVQINNPVSFAVARLTTAGILDPSFDGDGKQIVNFNNLNDVAYSVAVDSQNRVVVAGRTNNGTNYDFALARLTEAGALDATFGFGGKQTVAFGTRDDTCYDVAVDSLGKIVVGGFSYVTQTKRVFAVARFTTNGVLDPSFHGDGKILIDFGGNDGFANSVAIASGNRVLIAGYSNASQYLFSVARLTGDSTIANAEVNNGAVQRSRVDSVRVLFSGPVTFSGTASQAFTLTRAGGGAVAFTATVDTQNGATVVTLQGFNGPDAEFGSLRDGRYTLTALASQISAGGQQFDGDGDGVSGGNFVFGEAQGLFRFFGDINGDRRVDIADYGLFSLSYLNASVLAFDFNGDGIINNSDYVQFALRYLTMLP